MVLAVSPARKPADAVGAVRTSPVIFSTPGPVTSANGSAASVAAPEGKYYAFSLGLFAASPGLPVEQRPGLYFRSVTQYATYNEAKSALDSVAAAGCPQGAAAQTEITIAGHRVYIDGHYLNQVAASNLTDARWPTVDIKTIERPAEPVTQPPATWAIEPSPATPQAPTIVRAAAPTVTHVASVTLDKIMLLAGYVAPGYTVRSATFRREGKLYTTTPSGELRTDVNTNTGESQLVGAIDPASGNVELHTWAASENTALDYWSAFQARPTEGINELPLGAMVMGRTARAPLRPESFQVVARMADGVEVITTGDANGFINHSRIKGQVDYETGVFSLFAVSPVATGYGTIDLAPLNLPGVGVVHVDSFIPSALRYNAVAFEYIPVDAEVVGVDPVRLPSDGRVPIFEVGNYVVVHRHELNDPQTVTDGQLISLGVERVSRISIIDANGQDIGYGWARDLDAGTVKILTTAAVTEDGQEVQPAWAQPVRIGYSIEHMALARDVDISGRIVLNRKLPHTFPADGRSYISSALMLGDRFARVSALWDQQTWDGVTWVDHIVGNPATPSYDDTVYPIAVDNTGAITQRWAIRFTSTTAFQLIGENVGVVAAGEIFSDFEPLNPATGTPYMSINWRGWKGGWASGITVRINTVGAIKGFNVVRAVQPGDYTRLDHRFSLLARVDVDRPGEGDTQ